MVTSGLPFLMRGEVGGGGKDRKVSLEEPGDLLLEDRAAPRRAGRAAGRAGRDGGAGGGVRAGVGAGGCVAPLLLSVCVCESSHSSTKSLLI